VRLRDGVQRLRLLPDPTLRLQAFSDLDGDGGDEILVATTTAGCCGGYRLLDSSTAVVTLADGHLRVVGGDRRWRLFFDQGRGDVYAGIVCACDTVTQVTLMGFSTYDLTRTTWRITGALPHRIQVTRAQVTGDPLELSASECPGMDASGWAGP